MVNYPETKRQTKRWRSRNIYARCIPIKTQTGMQAQISAIYWVFSYLATWVEMALQQSASGVLVLSKE